MRSTLKPASCFGRSRAGDHPRAKSTGSATVTTAGYTFRCRQWKRRPARSSPTSAARSAATSPLSTPIPAKNSGRRSSFQEEPKPRGKNKEGVTLYGPAGGSVWNPPTVDPKRHRIYVGTGNGVSEPATEGTDSVIAMDMESGKIVWQHQEFKGDVFINNCRATGEPGRQLSRRNSVPTTILAARP